VGDLIGPTRPHSKCSIARGRLRNMTRADLEIRPIRPPLRAGDGDAKSAATSRPSELSVIDHHFDQFRDLVPRKVTRI
jgi:hypothetical protein